MCSPQRSRDVTIDIIRGLAVFTMVAANLGPVVAAPHSLSFRLYGSFAAPLFITFAGMMVALTRKGRDFSYYLLRGFLVMLVGVFLDICAFKIMPFLGVDVLYLIGLSIPLSFLLSKTSAPKVAIVTLIIFILTPVLQNYFGYTLYPTEYDLQGDITIEIDGQTSILQHWLLDGFFPVFPWFGFSCLGVFLAQKRWEGENPSSPFWYMPFGLLAMMVGTLLWINFPGPLHDREGFSELFYPATPGYILLSVGIIFFLLYFIDKVKSFKALRFFSLFGESALFMYVFHELIIGNAIFPYVPDLNFKQFLLYYSALIAAMTLLGLLIHLIKKRFKNLPYLIRFLIGG